jgi:ABC-type uncharacterized transport system ATPase subunit
VRTDGDVVMMDYFRVLLESVMMNEAGSLKCCWSSRGADKRTYMDLSGQAPVRIWRRRMRMVVATRERVDTLDE